MRIIERIEQLTLKYFQRHEFGGQLLREKRKTRANGLIQSRS
jgi:hypothetical protein